MNPKILTVDQAKNWLQQHKPICVVTPSCRAVAQATLGIEHSVSSVDALADKTEVSGVFLFGGGSMIDAGKAWRQKRQQNIPLLVCPSLWGSGAEVSPIAVVWRDGKKVPLIDDALLPDAVVYLPEIAPLIPPKMAVYGKGDAFSHAVEGFLSPLAKPPLRSSLAELLRQMIAQANTVDPVWFSLSGRACFLQSQSSVGLIHGIAHEVEPLIMANDGASAVGHAAITSTLLFPVLSFVVHRTKAIPGKGKELFDQYGIDVAILLSIFRSMFDDGLYEKVMLHAKECWRSILRNPCTRTNSALVKSKDLQYLLDREFLS